MRCRAGGGTAAEACPSSCFGGAVELLDGRLTVSSCFGKQISFISVDVGCTGTCTAKFEEVRKAAPRRAHSCLQEEALSWVYNTRAPGTLAQLR